MQPRIRVTLVGSLFLICLIIAADGRSETAPTAATQSVNDDSIRVYFSPHGGCTAAIVEQIKAATKSVDLQAYSFTSLDIAKALAEAHDRGVKVRVILDRRASRNQPRAPTYLTDHQLPTWTDGKHPIAHNKVIIIDGEIVITGSFNFSQQAENSNAENLLILRKPKIAAEYEKNFEHHLEHSTVLEGVKPSTRPTTQPS